MKQSSKKEMEVQMTVVINTLYLAQEGKCCKAPLKQKKGELKSHTKLFKYG